MTSSSVTSRLFLITWLLAVPTLAYAAYVALEIAAYVPFPGEDTSRHGAAYLFSALLGGIAVMAMALTVGGVGTAGGPATRLVGCRKQ